MLAQEHQRHLLAVEPAGAGKLAVVDHDVMGDRLGVAADHQRGREWPRLRSEVSDAPTHDARLFAGLAANRILDRLAWLDEAGEARPHARCEPVRTAEHAALAGD